jgi:hypothetical protein
MNIEAIRAQIEVLIAKLQAALDEAEKDKVAPTAPEEEAANDPVIEDEDADRGPVLPHGIDWDEYFHQKDLGGTPIIPFITIPEGAEQVGDWYWDGEFGWIFKPLLDRRDKLLAGDRDDRYSAKTQMHYAYKYICVPPGYAPTPEQRDLMMKNYNLSQVTRFFGIGSAWGRKRGYKTANAYSAFKPRANQKGLLKYEGDEDFRLHGYKTLVFGNKQPNETALELYWRITTAFQKHNANRIRNGEIIIGSDKRVLKRLDRTYNGLSTANKAKFRAVNPAYEPK